MMNQQLDENQLLFPSVEAKFILMVGGLVISTIELPDNGVTYYPPEPIFEIDDVTQRIRIRFDFLDGDGMLALRRVINFWAEDPTGRKIVLSIPGEIRGYEVTPYGTWREWFFDNQPQGYGPVEAVFITQERPFMDVIDVNEKSEPDYWIIT